MEISLPDIRSVSTSRQASASRSTSIAVAYAFAFVGFLVVPAAFRMQAPAPFPSGFYWQEVLDLATPLVLMPLSWLLCTVDQPATQRRTQLLFLVLAAVWVEGQAMHLAANSIGRPWEHAPSPSGALAEWYDETLSHYVWHVGIDAIFAMAIFRSLTRPYGTAALSRRLPLAVAGAILGFGWFMVVIESGTAPLDVLFMIAALAGIAASARRRTLGSAPIASFLTCAFAVTLALVVVWAIAWHGLPQFTEVGWL